jgi:hypothetical protein
MSHLAQVKHAANILGNAIATAVLGRSHDNASRPRNQNHHDNPAVAERAELAAVR